MNCTELNSNTIYVYIQTYQLGKKYLIRALDSIRKQTYPNFRCLIYDNCSDMEIRNRLQEYVKEDPRFSVTYFDNTEGHIIAWEYGIPEILHLAGDKGGFYCRVDADDELEPKCFEKTLTYMKENALDMAASGSTFIEADTMKVRGIRKIQENIILEGALFEKNFPQYYQI
ncbi:MAG: glycosyltransferase family 2 protein, partial [Anaerobutyricum sp.]